MKLFEYQAKEAFREKGLPTPKGVLVRGMDELDGAFAEVGFPCVLKSQVLSGGRGKAGLIKVVKDAESARAIAKALFESEHNVRMLLVEEAVDIDREIYLSITVDPVESKIMLIGCAEGGVEIEKLAATAPEKIVTVRVDIAEGLGGYHVNNLIYGMGLSGDLGKQVGAIVRGLYKTFRAYDAQLAEINPLFITKDGRVVVNELAPRPHNSGHYTIEACSIDQFDAHIRGIAGWPLIQPKLLSPAVMVNVLGQHVAPTRALIADHPEWNVHDYGKAQVRHNRKMGHITVLTDDTAATVEALEATGCWDDLK